MQRVLQSSVRIKELDRQPVCFINTEEWVLDAVTL